MPTRQKLPEGLSHLSTRAWRNLSADKTPNPKLINIKASTRLSSFTSTPSMDPASSNCFPVLSLTLYRSFYPLIINGTGCFTLQHRTVFLCSSLFFHSVCGLPLNRRSSTGKAGEQMLMHRQKKGERRKSRRGEIGLGCVCIYVRSYNITIIGALIKPGYISNQP